MKKCPYCSEGKGTAGHVRWCKANPKHEEYLEKLEKARQDRADNGNKSGNQFTKNPDYQVSLETREKISKSNTNRHHSPETRAKLSLIKRRWLEENPELHPWKRPGKFTSVPCEKLKSDLREKGYFFEEEVTPSSNRFFCVDILFREARLIIEVNGGQHYSGKDVLAPYYQERHDFLMELGWEILEIHYSLCFNGKALALVEEKLKSTHGETDITGAF